MSVKLIYCRYSRLQRLETLKVEEREEVRIAGFTDRLYQSAPDEVTLGGLEGGRCLKLTKVRD